MAEKATVDNLAWKFEQWAKSLPEDEQATLAEWADRRRGDDVHAHGADTWWKETGAWARWWSESWDWS